MSIIEKKASATPATPPSGYVHWYVTSTGQPQYVDESGIVRNFLGPTGPTGPTGATGPVGPAGATGPYGPSASYNVLNYGMVANDPTAAAANVTAWNTLMSTISTYAWVMLPIGATFYISGPLSIPSGKHVVVRAEGQNKAFIVTTSATADIFSCGDTDQEFRNMVFASAVTRTAGAAINSGGYRNIHVRDCTFTGMWDGITMTGGTYAGQGCTVTDSVFTGTLNRGVYVDGTNAAPLLQNIAMTGTQGAQAYGVYVNQCAYMLIYASGLNNAQYNLYVAPGTGAFANEVVAVSSSLDGASIDGCFIGGAGSASRIRFVNVTFNGCTNGAEITGAGAALPSGIDFNTCEFLGNSGRGIYFNGAQDVNVNSCRIAGNATAGIEANAAAGSVTRLLARNNTIGPTAGYAGNGIGIDINAGTYAGYQIVGNDVRNNTISITDGGSVAYSDLRVVRDNIGHLVSGAVGSIPANVVQTGTTELVVMSARVLPYAAQVGTTFRIRACGTTTTAGGAPTLRVRAGSAGTTADAAGWANASGTNPGANTPIQGEWMCTVKSVGTSGTVIVEGWGINALGTMQRGAGAPLTVTVNTNATWYIDFTSVMSGAGVNTWTNGVIEVI